MSILRNLKEAVSTLFTGNPSKYSTELVNDIVTFINKVSVSKNETSALALWDKLLDKYNQDILFDAEIIEELIEVINYTNHKNLANSMFDLLAKGVYRCEGFAKKDAIIDIVKVCSYDSVAKKAWMELKNLNLTGIEKLDVLASAPKNITTAIWGDYKIGIMNDYETLCRVVYECCDTKVVQETWKWIKYLILYKTESPTLESLTDALKRLQLIMVSTTCPKTAKDAMEFVDIIITKSFTGATNDNERTHEKTTIRTLYLNIHAVYIICHSPHKEVKKGVAKWLSKGLGKQRHELTSKTEKELAMETIEAIVKYAGKFIADGDYVDNGKYKLLAGSGVLELFDNEEQDTKGLYEFFLKMPAFAYFLLNEDWNIEQLKYIAREIKDKHNKEESIANIITNSIVFAAVHVLARFVHGQ